MVGLTAINRDIQLSAAVLRRVIIKERL